MTRELERIRDAESQQLDATTASLTPTNDDSSSSSTSPATASDDDHPHATSLKQKIADAVTPDALKQQQQHKQSPRSHDSVSSEVAELKAKLERRRKLEGGADPAVEAAKEGLVQCLRTKDRRPLDCWREVESFKAEVAKLEQKFVDRALR